MLRRQLYSLNGLQSFEAVARHLSFQKAAEELDVTSTAVSHQIKKLEKELGLLLFRRRPRPLTLTPAGELLFPRVQKSLDVLDNAILELRQINNPTELTVSVLNVFASKWLVPRLNDFQRRHPDIDVRLQTSNTVVDLQARTVDIAIRYGQGNYSGLEVHHLIQDQFTPVCSPKLFAYKQNSITPKEISQHTLIHFDWLNYGSEAPSWKNWLAKAELSEINADKGLKFDDENLAIQAAIAGQGIALCSSIHVQDDVKMGFLIQPFDITLPGFIYSVVYLKNHPKKAFILQFVSWLKEQTYI
ncbi:transcriptional regulator GcvA [Cyanobacterium aponinum]|uniref:Transcriptional regulator GcvA n=1 Tax=Cyanobacterium aponinum 0216 TaxID=2676140 RepID=A0A844GV94_9CHRO|nr:transcriptional regulator GcvA [Cyanobacterium aponinum]MTF40030.1 transcriptional regulator GcvA [Cyanobacterium aponinum 0216]